MKHSHRRQIIRDLATWLAIPLSLGQGAGLAVLDSANESLEKDRKPRSASGGAIRPRVLAPKGSVMRRG